MMNVDHLPGDTVVRAEDGVYQCRMIGADVRPNWKGTDDDRFPNSRPAGRDPGRSRGCIDVDIASARSYRRAIGFIASSIA
jgi:hypothetical protein